ncbi:MAG: zinc-dependent alcohol dehydrogenase [Alkalispirochaeta sp.]
MGLQRRVWEVQRPFYGQVIREEVALPGPQEVVVEAEWGAVSPGSEYATYSGAARETLRLDAAAGERTGDSVYPLRYGYILTGRISFCGSDVDRDQWLGRRVYAFHSHATHAILPVDAVLPIPETVPADLAPLYANTETALSVHWDAGVLAGEAVVIVGAGIVGLIAAGIAVRSGAGWVVVVEPEERRRSWARRYLHDDSGIPEDNPARVVASLEEASASLREYPGRYHGTYEGFDVAFELTGNPNALGNVLAAMGFGGRIVVGSWYGDRDVALPLGGRFHRSRLRLISSQVSTIPLSVHGRIDYARRSRIVWHMMPHLNLEKIARREITLDELNGLFTEISEGSSVEPWVSIRY